MAASQAVPLGDLIGAVGPVLRAQLALEDLAGSRWRQYFDELDAAGRLIAGDECGALRPDLFRAGLLVRQQHHHGVDALTPGGSGTPITAHQDRIGDLVLGDAPRDRGRLEHRNDHVCAADQPTARPRGDARHMKQGDAMQQSSAGRDVLTRHQAADGRYQHVVVGSLHSLGVSRGPAGVEHAEQIVAAGVGVFDRGAFGEQALVVQRAGGRFPFAAVDRHGQVREMLAQAHQAPVRPDPAKPSQVVSAWGAPA